MTEAYQQRKRKILQHIRLLSNRYSESERLEVVEALKKVLRKLEMSRFIIFSG